MEAIKLYLHHLNLYDYIGFAFVGIVFFLLFLIGIILLFKRRFSISFLTLFLSFMIIPIGFLGVKYMTDKSLREAEINIIKMKPLHFSRSTLMEAKLKNRSKISYNECLVTIKVYKKSDSKVKSFLYRLKPLAKKTISIKREIPKGGTIEIKSIFDGVVFNEKTEDYKLDSLCY